AAQLRAASSKNSRCRGKRQACANAPPCLRQRPLLMRHAVHRRSRATVWTQWYPVSMVLSGKTCGMKRYGIHHPMTGLDRPFKVPIMANESKSHPRRYTLFGMAIEATKAAPGLHIVATPIGNLADITLRALEVLAGADVIACEDTRVTRKLVDRYGIATPLTPYHEHNAAEARPKLLARLAAKQAVALVSDA